MKLLGFLFLIGFAKIAVAAQSPVLLKKDFTRGRNDERPNMVCEISAKETKIVSTFQIWSKTKQSFVTTTETVKTSVSGDIVELINEAAKGNVTESTGGEFAPTTIYTAYGNQSSDRLWTQVIPLSSTGNTTLTNDSPVAKDLVFLIDTLCK